MSGYCESSGRRRKKLALTYLTCNLIKLGVGMKKIESERTTYMVLIFCQEMRRS